LREGMKFETRKASFEAFNKLPPIQAEDLGLGDAVQMVKPGGILS
jgi:hypothetical protein